MFYEFAIQPAFKNRQAIVTCPDNNFVKFFGATLASLIENASPEENYDIIIFDRDITEENKKRLLKGLPDNFSLRFFKTGDFLKDSFKGISFDIGNRHWTESSYYRLFIPFIMQKYEKVLYMDSDTIVNRSLDSIFKIDFENKKVMACRDTFAIQSHLPKDEMRLDYIKNTLKVENIHDYFNSGVMLFNIPAINLEEYNKNLIEIFKTIKVFLFVDQEVLNSVFAGQVKYIPFEYNLQIGYLYTLFEYEATILDEFKTDFLNAKKNPVIIHYTTQIKPWNLAPKYEPIDIMDIYWYYARKTMFYEEVLFARLAENKTPEKNKSAKKRIKYSFLEKIFSVKNDVQKGHKRKIITLLGIKISFKVK